MWNWDENRYHLAPVTGSRRVVPVEEWAAFIREGRDPAQVDARLEIQPDVQAERHLPAARMVSPW